MLRRINYARNYPGIIFAPLERVRSGYETHERVRSGHETHERVRTGHETRERVRTGHETHERVRSGHETHERVRSGHETRERVRSGHETRERVRTGHETNLIIACRNTHTSITSSKSSLIFTMRFSSWFVDMILKTWRNNMTRT